MISSAQSKSQMFLSKICHPQRGEAAVVLLVRHPPGLLQHLLCRRGALQSASLAHTVPRSARITSINHQLSDLK